MSKLFNATIYLIDYSYTKNTVVCKIKWKNPFTNNTQISTGVARCNPDDKYDEKTGRIISESRAKSRLYRTIKKSMVECFIRLEKKYDNLLINEHYHLQNVIGKENINPKVDNISDV